MPLSKARNRARNKLWRAEQKAQALGLPIEQPTSNLAISCLPPDERKAVLKEIALHAIETHVSAGHKIAAIKEINLMEHIYDPQPAGNDNRHITFIFQVQTQAQAEAIQAGILQRALIGGNDVQGQRETEGSGKGGG